MAGMMRRSPLTAIVRTDARAEAKERFYSAALWWMADQSCSSAFAEMEEAYEALMALAGPALAETLAQADAARRAREAA